MEDRPTHKPGDTPLELTDNRKLFCKYHYKGVLTIVVPLVFGPVLLAKPVVAFRYIYITLCMFAYYLLDLMARGVIALFYVVFAPLMGIADSKKVCIAYYTDSLFMVYGCCFLAIMMQSSKLSQHLAFIVIRLVGSRIKIFQLFLAIVVAFLAFFTNPVAAASVSISVAKAVLTEYDRGGIFNMYSDEPRYEIGSDEYPSFPTVGIYLTLCYTATMAGAVSPIVNPNSNIVDAFHGALKMKELLLIMVLPVVVGTVVMILWIQIVFLGLFGGPIKRELKELADNEIDFEKSVEERKAALGRWKIHAILSCVFLLLVLIAMHTRRPRIYPGWDSISDNIITGYSVQSLGIVVFAFAIPANYLFCRYYACRQPEPQGTAPSLLSWKTLNRNTPYGEILMLASTFCGVYCAKASGLYKAIAKAVAKPRGTGLQFLYGVLYGTLFTTLSPATSLADIALPIMRHAGANFALPFATALHNQFLLPTSAPVNTIVSGMGNVRPFLFLLGGIVPAIFMMISITASTWVIYGLSPKGHLENATFMNSKW